MTEKTKTTQEMIDEINASTEMSGEEKEILKLMLADVVRAEKKEIEKYGL